MMDGSSPATGTTWTVAQGPDRLDFMTLTVVVPKISFDIRYTRNPDGVITVECITLPGCVSQGRTRAEATRNIRAAIRAWLAAESAARRKGWKPVWERGVR